MRTLIILLTTLIVTACADDRRQHLDDEVLKVGNAYKLCVPNDNPYYEINPAIVIILDMREGYVQYCWAHEAKDPDVFKFSRSEEEFQRLIKYCK